MAAREHLGLRRIFATVALTGLIAATASVVGAGYATAEPDTTGAHHIDPRGYHHDDSSPLRQAEHDEARREYFNDLREQLAASRVPDGEGSGAATWRPVQQQDGSGWTVCPRLASHC